MVEHIRYSPRVAELLEAVEQRLERMHDLVLASLLQLVVVVVPDVGARTAHDPRLAEVESEGGRAQEAEVGVL